MKKQAFAGLAVLVAVQAQALNLVSDAGFEVPIVGGGTFQQINGGNPLGAWTVVGSDVLLINRTYSEVPTITFNSHSGNQAVDLTGRGNTGLANGVFQNVATVAGQSYTVSYWIGRAQGQSNDNRYQTPAVARLLIDGALAQTATNADSVAAGKVGWKQFSHSFVASGALTRIEFLNGVPASPAAGWNNYVGLDSVEVVPEPMTLGVLALAAAGLARRNRKA